MHPYVFHNDRLVELEQARLSPGQSGLLSGWGLFTTLRIYDGQPFEFVRHWARLERDSKRVDLPLSVSRERTLEAVRELIAANRVKSGCMRVYFLHNRAGFWKSDEPGPAVDFLLYSTDLPARGDVVRLAMQEHGRYAAHPLAGTKVTSWLDNVWSLQRANARGFQEVILLNERGEVAECTAANLFVVRGGEVRTPPLEAGCLAGVTREVLLEAGTPAGVRISQAVLLPRDLEEADEVFITSTTREVQPVEAIEAGARKQAPGPITSKLRKWFSEYVAEHIAAQAATAKRS